MKPTIIKTNSGPDGKIKPSVIKPGDEGANDGSKKKKVGASVISLPAPAKKDELKASVMAKPVEETASKPTEIKAGKVYPSVISGQVRVRIPVTTEELLADNPGTPGDIIGLAIQRVLETNLDAVKSTSVVLWGAELQKKYSENVLQLLHCSQDECLSKSSTQVSRVVEILEAIDIRGVCEYRADGMISKMFKNSNKEYDTPEELLHAEKELKHLTSLLSEQLKKLTQLQVTLQKLSGEIESSGREIKAAALAAAFISKYLQRQGPETENLSNQFFDRSMSLTQTEAQIMENEAARKMQLEYPLNLIAVIQNAVLVMVPDWLGSISSIRSMLDAKKRISVTEINEISDWQKKIVRTLKQ